MLSEKLTITITDLKNEYVVNKLKINADWLKSASNIQKEITENNHITILDNDSIWIFKKVEGLNKKNYKINKEQEQKVIKNILQDWSRELGFTNKIDNYCNFETFTNRKIEYLNENKIENSNLVVFTAIENNSNSETLQDQIERIFNDLHSSDKTIINSKSEIYKIGQPLKTIFENERLRGLEIFKRAIEIADIDLQNVETEYDKQKVIDLDKAKNHLKYSFKRLGVQENIETDSVDEYLKQYLINDLSCFKDINLNANYVHLYKTSKNIAKFHKADISTDKLLYQIKGLLESDNINVTKEDIKTAVTDERLYISKDSVKERIKELDLTWDGQDWFNKLYKYITIKSDQKEYFEKYFKIWFVGMVKQYFNHENYIDFRNDFMLILKGDGSVGKSQFAHSLIPKDLFPLLDKPTFKSSATKFDPSDDKCLTPAFGKILGIIEEFSINSHDKNEAFKDLITTDTYQYRPMRENAIEIRKTFSMIGFTNQDEILYDLSGNRRFIVCEIDKLDWNYSNKIDFKQLFLQAIHLAENDWQTYKFTRDKGKEVEEYSISYSKSSLEKEYINTHFESDVNGKIKLMDIISHLNSKGLFTTNQKLLRSILQDFKRSNLLDGNVVYMLKIK